MRCIVFDDDPDVLATRKRLAKGALRHLAGRELIEGDVELVAASTRTACLQAIATCESAIAIADMAGRHAYAGNLGARLLRAIAEREQTAARTWRILWTQHDHPEIAREMASPERPQYAHALAHYDPDDPAPVIYAIAHAIAAPAARARDIATFPAVRPIKDWEADLRRRLERITGGDLMPGDERIALDLYHQVPAAMIDAMLDALGEQAHRASVNALLHAIIDAGFAGSVAGAHRALEEAVAPVCQQSAGDILRPNTVKTADMTLNLLRDYDDDERCELTWLTPAQDKLARVFIRCFKQHPPGRRNDRVTPYGALERALNDPDYVSERDKRRLTDQDLSYAIWTLVDTRVSLLAEQ